MKQYTLKNILLYEDEHLIIANKPRGVISRKKDITKSQNYIALDEILMGCGISPCYAAHRLDKLTTGAIVFSRSPEVQDIMANLFEKRKVKKLYLGKVIGKYRKGLIIINKHIAREIVEEDGQKYYRALITTNPAYKPKPALTICHQLEYLPHENASIVAFYSYTGRTNQIRVHSACKGHPLVNDKRHQKKPKPGKFKDDFLLHAAYICFDHPKPGKEMDKKVEIAIKPLWWNTHLQDDALMEFFREEVECMESLRLEKGLDKF